MTPLPTLSSSRDCLFLDIDGTMLDLAPHPDAVIVPDSLLQHRARLQQRLGGALAVISGRTLDAIDRLLPLNLTAAGTHGACWRIANAPSVCVMPLPDALRAALKDRFPALLVEDKGHAVAVHYRQTPSERPAILAQIHQIIAAAGMPLKLIDGKAVFEIMAPNIDKGIALKLLIADFLHLLRKKILWCDFFIF